MKYLFLDCYAFLSPCMLASALHDMTKDKNGLEKLCAALSDVCVFSHEEKRCGMEAEFIRIDYKIEKEEITTGDLKLMCEKLSVSEKTKEKLDEYISIIAEAKSIDPSLSVFDTKTAIDSLVFLAYVFETIFSFKIEKVYVSKVLVPSYEFLSQTLSDKISNSKYILKKCNICPTPTPLQAPSFSEEWAAMCAVLNASHKDTNTGSIIKIGYGAGEDDIEEIPNILRAVYGEEEEGDMLFEAEMALGLNFEIAQANA